MQQCYFIPKLGAIRQRISDNSQREAESEPVIVSLVQSLRQGANPNSCMRKTTLVLNRS